MADSGSVPEWAEAEEASVGDSEVLAEDFREVAERAGDGKAVFKVVYFAIASLLYLVYDDCPRRVRIAV